MRVADGMFGIKLVTPAHLDGIPYFNPPANPPKRSFMNFKSDSKARSIPEGHRAVVYVSRLRKFIWTIEFEEIIEVTEYDRLLKPWGKRREDLGKKWKFIRPIRFIAWMDHAKDYAGAPTFAEMQRRIHYPKHRFHGEGNRFIDRKDFELLYRNIAWDHTAR